MNILVLCTSDALGGLELYAEREVDFLRRKSEHTCHFALRQNGRLAERQKNTEKQHNFHLQWRSRIWPYICAVKLARYIDRHEIDLIHMHWAKDINLASLAKRISHRKPKLVYTRHMRISQSKKNPYHRFFYSQIDQLLTVSRQVEQEARKFFPLPADHIKNLYLGVPPANNFGAGDEHEQLPGSPTGQTFRIGMFSRIEQGKGQHLLVEAMGSLLEKGLDVSATFIGHVMDESYFSGLTRLTKEKHLDQRIHFVGFVDKPMEIMPQFDVIVLLTYGETFGLVLVEAMRSGVAVIGTNSGGVPEIIHHEESGLLIQEGNADALVDAISRLYEDSEFKTTLANNGKKRADRYFDEQKNFKSLLSVLNDFVPSTVLR